MDKILYGDSLLLEGSKTLAKMSLNGLRVDVDYLQDVRNQYVQKEKQLTKELWNHPDAKDWIDKYGAKTNFSSDDQFREILFNKFGLKPKKFTDSGSQCVDENSLIDYMHLPLVNLRCQLRKTTKVLSTFIEGILAETTDGYCHPFFNLGTVSTLRSSSNAPNLQNIPKRDKEIKNLVRRAFIPREGHRILEADFSGAEVRIACCYHKDPQMFTYLMDKSADMHRDCAARCFCISADEVTKELRYFGKNQWVFPQFYGSRFNQCAAAMWESIQKLSPKTKSGVLVSDILRSHGITSLGETSQESITRRPPREGTMVKHLQEVEDWMWKETFPVYNKWRFDWWKSFKEKGYFDTLTGFRFKNRIYEHVDKKSKARYLQGLRFTEVINIPVQGSAFHCLLYSVILMQDEIEKRGLQTKLISEIHDSAILDVPEVEFEEVSQLIYELMTERVPELWKSWILIPLECELEATDINRPWNESKPVEMKK